MGLEFSLESSETRAVRVYLYPRVRFGSVTNFTGTGMSGYWYTRTVPALLAKILLFLSHVA